MLSCQSRCKRNSGGLQLLQIWVWVRFTQICLVIDRSQLWAHDECPILDLPLHPYDKKFLTTTYRKNPYVSYQMGLKCMRDLFDMIEHQQVFFIHISNLISYSWLYFLKRKALLGFYISYRHPTLIFWTFFWPILRLVVIYGRRASHWSIWSSLSINAYSLWCASLISTRPCLGPTNMVDPTCWTREIKIWIGPKIGLLY